MVFQLRAAVARRPLHYNVLSGRLVSVRDSVSAERLPARSPSLLRDQAACPGRWRPLPRATVQRAPCVRQQALELDCFAFAILDRSTRPAPARSCSARESTARGGKYFPSPPALSSARASELCDYGACKCAYSSARIPTVALPARGRPVLRSGREDAAAAGDQEQAAHARAQKGRAERLRLYYE